MRTNSDAALTQITHGKKCTLSPLEIAIYSQLFLLTGFSAFSLFGIHSLPFWSGLAYTQLGYVLLKLLFKGKIPPQVNALLIGIGLWTFFGSLVYFRWLDDIWTIPSQDDTLNHLGYLEVILKSNLLLIGKIDKPGSEWFGTVKYHFYPTGAHGLMALWIYPFFQLAKDWTVTFKLLSTLMVAGFPAFLWWSGHQFRPELSKRILFFIVISCTTQAIFPLDAFGEGGISRTIALVLFAPLFLRMIFIRNLGIHPSLFGSLIAPILLLIHPCILPLIGIGVGFLRKKHLVQTLLSAPIGMLLFYFILKSGHQEVFDTDFVKSLIHTGAVDIHSLFERIKAPFHFWFSDSLGFGKFLSPKNIPIFISIYLILRRKISLRFLSLVLLPFVLSTLSFLPFEWSHHLGMIYYHSTKRISELTPLLGFCLSLSAMIWASSNGLFKKSGVKTGSVVLSLIFLSIYVRTSQSQINHFHKLFKSPTLKSVHETNPILAVIQPSDILLVDNHAYDFVRFTRKEATVFTLRPECQELGEISIYCKKRLLASSGTIPFERRVWLIPNQNSKIYSRTQVHNNQLPLIKIE